MEAAPEQPRVLFVSPYPICPPVHGGGVFMYQALREMARLTETHVVELLDVEWQIAANEELREFCASAGVPGADRRPCSHGGARSCRMPCGSSPTTIWNGLIHRQMYLKKIDVVQLEYTPLAQYGGSYRRIASVLFEHERVFPVDRAGAALHAGNGGPRQGAPGVPAGAAL